MARVFMSFLGTNDYVPCNYYIDETKVEKVRFIQEAIVSISCRDWTAEDRILIFTTDLAEKNNWKEGGHSKREFEKETAPEGLFKRLVNLNHKAEIINIRIKEGFSEEEITEIFNTVYEYINEDDEIIFDITHALRSIPMLAIVILNYAKVLKNIRISRIHYGPFEKLGRLDEVKKMPVEDRNVPILDLSTFDRLLDWSFGVERFVSSGDASRLSSLMQDDVKKILVKTKGGSAEAQNLKSLGRGLGEFSKRIATCRAGGRSDMNKCHISEQAISNKRFIGEYQDSTLLPAFRPLFHKIDKSFEPFTGNPVNDGIEAAKWCHRHGYIQQGITILHETMITHLVLSTGGEMMNQKTREAATRVAGGIAQQNKDDGKIYDITSDSRLTDNIDYASVLYDYLKLNLVFAADIVNLGPIRNDMNHAGYRNDALSPDDFAISLNKYIEKFEAFLIAEQEQKEQADDVEGSV